MQGIGKGRKREAEKRGMWERREERKERERMRGERRA